MNHFIVLKLMLTEKRLKEKYSVLITEVKSNAVFPIPHPPFPNIFNNSDVSVRPEGKREIGRPKMRWRDSVNQDAEAL
jgi:hypothetical protein